MDFLTMVSDLLIGVGLGTLAWLASRLVVNAIKEEIKEEIMKEEFMHKLLEYLRHWPSFIDTVTEHVMETIVSGQMNIEKIKGKESIKEVK